MSRLIRGVAFACALAVGACGGGAESSLSGDEPSRADSGDSANVDVFLRDSATDDGRVDAESGSAHWESPDIKVDAPPFADAPSTAGEFDALESDAYRPGEEHRVYVRVANRGAAPAQSVGVTLYAGPAGTMLPAFPIDAEPGDGRAWTVAGEEVIEELEPSAAGARVVAFPLPPLNDSQCLIVVAEAGEDPARVRVGPADAAVMASNNVTARNMDSLGSRLRRELVVSNPSDGPARATLELRAPPEAEATLDGLDSESTLRMEGGDQRTVVVEVADMATRDSGELTVKQRLETGDGEVVAGGFTLALP